MGAFHFFFKLAPRECAGQAGGLLEKSSRAWHAAHTGSCPRTTPPNTLRMPPAVPS